MYADLFNAVLLSFVLCYYSSSFSFQLDILFRIRKAPSIFFGFVTTFNSIRQKRYILGGLIEYSRNIVTLLLHIHLQIQITII